MEMRFLTVDHQPHRSCLMYLRRPDPHICVYPVTRDWYAAGVRDDLWSTVNRGQRLLVLDLTGLRKTGSLFVGNLMDVRSWLTARHGDLRLTGLQPDLVPWFERVLGGAPPYRDRLSALRSPLSA
jgi:hypothetical protein